MAPSIAIRVDASLTSGFGHVKRCLALAQALREYGAAVRFIARSQDVDVAALVGVEGFAVTMLPVPGAVPVTGVMRDAQWVGEPWNVDASQTITALCKTGVKWMVVDHYALDERWHRAVALALSCKVAAIDDLADRSMAVNVLIDHNLAASHRLKYAGRIAEGTILLGGPRFALLGPTYASAARYEFHDEVRSIGIFIGGTDASNLSAIALCACRHAGFDGPIEIVTTRSNPHLAPLAAMADARTTISVDLPELSAFFARHDLQIGAGGGATWERCRVGAPTLAVVAADNQVVVVPILAALGAVAGLPSASASTPQNLAQAIGELLSDPLQRRRLGVTSGRLVDGLGARRVALCLLSETLYVRTATAADWERTYLWRNHPDTRAVSRCAQPIDISDHQRWLEAALRNPQRHLMVGKVGGTEVGVVRMDEHDNGDVEVSLYLDPELHGIGLGSALLRAGEAYVAAILPSNRRLVATVLDHNPISRRLFESADYAFADGWWTKPLYHQDIAEDNAQ